MEETNPWNVSNIETFHFYCCPECDMKCNTKDQFIDHAMEWHPKAREILHFKMICVDNEPSVQCKSDEEFKEVKSVFPKEEPLSDSEMKENFSDESECMEVHQCDLCDTFYASKEELEVHKEGGHRCEHCDTIYNTAKEKKNHMVCPWILQQNSNCEPEMNQVVRSCQNSNLSKSTQTPSAILKPNETAKRYICDICHHHRISQRPNKNVTQSNRVKPKKRTRKNKQTKPEIDLNKLKPHLHACDKCEKSFFTKEKLKDHKKDKHRRWSLQKEYETC